MPDRSTPYKEQNSAGPAKLDLATAGGTLLAVAGLIGGLLLEKGQVGDIAQYTAAIIVGGGTMGAVLISTPLSVVKGAARRIKSIFFDTSVSTDGLIDRIVAYAAKARKGGLVSLEDDADLVADPFLRKALHLAVDGTDLQEMRKLLELQIMIEERTAEAEAKVFENAGGYSPTIGIIGAVMGLIQVMKNLANIDEVGHGIAVAFVATVYGVGAANLFLLPAANKIKMRIEEEAQRKDLIVEGVAGIVEGLNPKVLRMKLEAYGQQGSPAGPEVRPRSFEARAPVSAGRG